MKIPESFLELFVRMNPKVILTGLLHKQVSFEGLHTMRASIWYSIHNVVHHNLVLYKIVVRSCCRIDGQNTR